jgi:hypothetical protein
MSLGDFGTRENPGLNSIPMDNTYWVCNRNTWHPLPAVNNWWGTPTPYEYLERFIGPVSYRPWLVEPPDGGQSAGATEERWPCFAVRPTLVRERCAIAWTVERAGNASVRIYDASGRVVTTLADRCMAPGRYSAVWDGHTTSGACVPNGVYVCRVESASGSRCSKVAVMR